MFFARLCAALKLRFYECEECAEREREPNMDAPNWRWIGRVFTTGRL
jgi:hypothetical protein